MLQPQSRPEPASALAPVLPEERIVLLDVLRGIALFGILVMNIYGYSRPWSSWALNPPMFQGSVDRAAEFMQDFLFAGKANSIFSFLFGLGMTIQMQRAEARGGRLIPMYLRRLAVLFLFGIVHPAASRVVAPSRQSSAPWMMSSGSARDGLMSRRESW